MNLFRKLAFGLAIVCCSAPAAADVRAAAFSGASDRASPQFSKFVGAAFKLNLSRRPGESRYHATLGFGGMARNSGTSELRVGQGVGLALDERGKPSLHMAGSDVADLRQAANLSGGGKTALIVAGTAAALGLVALAVVDSARCEDEGNTCD